LQTHIPETDVMLFLAPDRTVCIHRDPEARAASDVPLSKDDDEEPTKRRI
jgi:hypothetical protein